MRKINNTLRTYNKCVDLKLKRELYILDSVVPKLYCLLKIHKLGKSVRLIVSAIVALTLKVSISHFSNVVKNFFKIYQ